MKYLCLVVVDEDLAGQMQADDWVRMGEESQVYDRELMGRGVFVAAQALVGKESARTVRVRGGEALITDGPFMEAKEVVAGFILIDVVDAEAAMAIAKGIPMARLGAVEVRPVMEFS